MARSYNFCAGPAVLPLETLETAQREFIDYAGSGMSIIESSHRGKEYAAVHEEAVANLRRLLALDDDHAVLFIQGGATMQFGMVSMNFLGGDAAADYVNSGSWAAKAIKEAKTVGRVNVAADTSREMPARMPAVSALKLTPGAAYVHITSNETIAGTQWKIFPDTESPLIADMSSDILSRPFDANRFALIYAGAQKNLGPAGVCLVVIRREFAERGPAALPSLLQYRTYLESDSLANTPPCFAIYMIALVTRWLLKEGLENIHERNRAKAAKLYAAIDAGGFYRGTAAPESRSDMNVTFRLPSEELEAAFIAAATKQGLKGLKGHRSVGGVRASIYNAFPVEGVDALIAFMKEFERTRG